MRSIILFTMASILILHADVVMKKSKHHDDVVTIPEHPIHRPDRPIHRPPYHHADYIPTGIIVETQSNCDRYIEMLDEKEAYIKELEYKLTNMQLQLQTLQSKYNKLTYDKEMHSVQKHKSSIKTDNRIIVSDKSQTQ